MDTAERWTIKKFGSREETKMWLGFIAGINAKKRNLKNSSKQKG